MFWTRLASGIVLMAIAITFLVLGGEPLFWLITVISLIGLFELYRTVDMEKSVPAVVGYLASILLDLVLRAGAHEYFLPVLIGAMMLVMACYVVAFPRFRSEQVIMVLFGLLYVTTMLSFVFQVRMLEEGVFLVWLIFVGAWGSDTCAYCVGKLIGKHKMPSKLSPNKTIEGCVGGVIGAALIGFIYAAVLWDFQRVWIAFAVIGAASSVISQIGDLTASAIKRNHEIKDYGHLIPGHGGILDRFDSIIFTAPIVYYLITLCHLGIQ
ncbi:MAG: phosphatidate cytidylyltransferase [Eubacteriales bacterium]|nr:phosphatidate cytidylyltransferase [Eubacteriales bacterium]